MTWRACVTWPYSTQGSSDPLHPAPPSLTFAHGTPLAKLNDRSAIRTLVSEGGRPQIPAEAWLRIAQCSTEMLGAGAARGGALNLHGVTLAAQL